MIQDGTVASIKAGSTSCGSRDEAGPTSQILGVRFYAGDAQGAVERGLKGGLVVVPSAPVLIDLEWDESNREALTQCDLAIADSGLMVLLWRLLTGERLTRVSGLQYLKLLLFNSDVRISDEVFWIMPNGPARDRNLRWLHSQGHSVKLEYCFVAPNYDREKIEDHQLADLLVARQPRHIIICLGGGVQEKLGLFLRDRLPYRPAIHCIGAAIGFLSGDQVNIPPWADRFFLGWLFRCLSAPSKFVPRYWRARRLIYLMWKYREKLPELKGMVT